MPATGEIIATICLVWYVFIVLVCTIGCVQLFRHYSKPPSPSISSNLPDGEAPHVTIIRPCKGREPYLYECLASTFLQDYPDKKLTIYFCVSTRDDPACATIRRLLAEHSQRDAKLLIEEEDPALAAGATDGHGLGPNPKIRNMSRAYREAKGDLVWILDCNVWVGRGACGRMVDRLCGYTIAAKQQPYKFVHHLPVAIDVPPNEAFEDEGSANTQEQNSTQALSSSTKHQKSQAYFGGRLDEAFLSTAHAKMYTAINTVAVAPCICGKSSMFRRSHLNALINIDHSTETRFGSGIDYFSENICEDHLIGDLLWKAKIPSTMPIESKHWRNHGLVYGDIALQPVSKMSVSNYVARRSRWLRVRKFTVPLATLVEPGTESFMCSLIGVGGLMTLSYTKSHLGTAWTTAVGLWVGSICTWIFVDRLVYCLLQSGKTVEIPPGGIAALPPFARQVGKPPYKLQRSFFSFLVAWLARETLTLPIWTWAIWGGVTVTWRDRKLWVGLDMKVHEMNEETDDAQRRPLLLNRSKNLASISGRGSIVNSSSKARQD